MGKITTFGEVDARSLKQLETCMNAGDAEFGVLCADHHPGYSQPIGGAVAYEGYVSPSGVGYDIGCGNKAVLTDITRADLAELRSDLEQHRRRVHLAPVRPAAERQTLREREEPGRGLVAETT